MREILFRGKQVDTGKWEYGSFVMDAREQMSGICGGVDGFIRRYNCDTHHMDTCEVDRDTIGQYTGLTDKNGVNIFEGDIVDLFGMKGKVVQECGSFGIAFMKTIDYDLLESKIPFNNSANFCFNDNFISLWEVFWNYEQDDNPLYDVEVIGNITDNPELLEEA